MDAALLRELGAIPLVDQHAHAVLRAHPETLDEFRGLLTESADPRQWPHVASAVSYRRAIAELAEELDCEATEVAVLDRRLAVPPIEYASRLLRTTRTEALFLDDGFPPRDAAFSLEEMSELAGCPARPALRIERVAEAALAAGCDLALL